MSSSTGLGLLALLLAAGAPLAAVGCATGREPAPEASLQVLSREPGAQRSGRADVTTDAGNLLVTGALTAPDPCRDLAAAVLSPGSGRLVLRVDVFPPEEGVVCAQALTRYRYRAALMNLEEGRYALTVVHDYRGSGWPPDTALASRQVVVP